MLKFYFDNKKMNIWKKDETMNSYSFSYLCFIICMCMYVYLYDAMSKACTQAFILGGIMI